MSAQKSQEQADSSTLVLDRAACSHPRTRVELLPRGHQHYARVVCEVCGKQLCWRPNPTNVERRRKNAGDIQKLLTSKLLTSWENGFCNGITQNPRLSPRQQETLDRLVETYLRKDMIIEHTRTNGALPHRCAA